MSTIIVNQFLVQLGRECGVLTIVNAELIYNGYFDMLPELQYNDEVADMTYRN